MEDINYFFKRIAKSINYSSQNSYEIIKKNILFSNKIVIFLTNNSYKYIYSTFAVLKSNYGYESFDNIIFYITNNEFNILNTVTELYNKYNYFVFFCYNDINISQNYTLELDKYCKNNNILLFLNNIFVETQNIINYSATFKEMIDGITLFCNNVAEVEISETDINVLVIFEDNYIYRNLLPYIQGLSLSHINIYDVVYVHSLTDNNFNDTIKTFLTLNNTKQIVACYILNPDYFVNNINKLKTTDNNISNTHFIFDNNFAINNNYDLDLKAYISIFGSTYNNNRFSIIPNVIYKNKLIKIITIVEHLMPIITNYIKTNQLPNLLEHLKTLKHILYDTIIRNNHWYENSITFYNYKRPMNYDIDNISLSIE
jgi:hypothetical protein